MSKTLATRAEAILWPTPTTPGQEHAARLLIAAHATDTLDGGVLLAMLGLLTPELTPEPTPVESTRGWITLAQAAQRLKITPNGVNARRRRGQLGKSMRDPEQPWRWLVRSDRVIHKEEGDN